MEASIFRILVVEDHADAARAVCKLMKIAGYKVKAANTVASAVALGISEPFDILLCDIGLPDGDGAEVLARIVAVRPITGIVMSGYGMDDDVKRILALGFVAHLVKPIDQVLLDSTISHALAVGRGVSAVQTVGVNRIDDRC